MKVIAQRISASPKYAKVLEWGKLVTITGSAQVLIKALALISGILVIRLLSMQEYAFYTLANTMLGTMTVLADGGIATGVMAHGGKVWQNPQKLGAVLATGLHLRKKFAVGSILVAAPVLFFLLKHHGASWLMAFLLMLSLIPAFLTSLSGTILEIAPKLRQDIVPLQKNQLEVNVGRFIILLLTLFAFPLAYIAIFSSSLPQIWANLRLRKISSGYADWMQKPDPVVQEEIIAIVKRVLPGAIYYCMSGQITIWLISIFGSTAAVAEVGALSRLSMVLTLFSMLFGILVVPRFARLKNNKNAIIKVFILIQAGLIGLGFVIVAFVNYFSGYFLWILGDEFSHLTTEVVLASIGSCISLINGCTFQLLAARGVIVPPVFFITSVIAVQVGLIFSVQLDEIMGVFMYTIWTTVAIYLIRLLYLLYLQAKPKLGRYNLS